MRLMTLFLLAAAPAAFAEAPTEWLGETPHFVLYGSIDGHEVAIDFRDAGAADIHALEAKREYLPGAGDSLRYGDFEIALEWIDNGVEKAIELEFENADFNAHAVPGSFKLQTEEFPEGALSNLEAELEWETADETVNSEIFGWSGRLDLALEPAIGQAEPSDEGMIGGFVTAALNGETLLISFTAPVAEYEIDD